MPLVSVSITLRCSPSTETFLGGAGSRGVKGRRECLSDLLITKRNVSCLSQRASSKRTVSQEHMCVVGPPARSCRQGGPQAGMCESEGLVCIWWSVCVAASLPPAHIDPHPPCCVHLLDSSFPAVLSLFVQSTRWNMAASLGIALGRHHGLSQAPTYTFPDERQ